MSRPTLFCKISPVASRVGDCPFTMRARLALALKKIDYDVKLVDLNNKSEEFLKYSPKDGTVVSESMDIVTQVAGLAPPPPAIMDAVGALLSKFFAWFKTSAAESPAALPPVKAALDDLTAFLPGEGPFLEGAAAPAAADVALAPLLYVMFTVSGPMKGEDLRAHSPKLAAFLAAAAATPEWQQVVFPPEESLEGFKKWLPAA